MRGGSQLQVIRQWCEEMGGTVEDVPLDPKVGRNLPSLGIVLGQLKLNAFEDPGGTVIVLMALMVGDDVRSVAHGIGSDAQAKMLLLLKAGLMENPRLVWSLVPPTLTSMEQLMGVQLMERLRVSEDDLSTFNRFSDALQEIVTAQFKLRELFSTTFGTPPPPRPKARSGMDADAASSYG